MEIDNMKNIFAKSFEVFLKEPLSLLKRSLVQVVSVQTNNLFASRSAFNVDLINDKTQVTIVNNERMFNIVQSALYRQKMKERENLSHENARKVHCKRRKALTMSNIQS